MKNRQLTVSRLFFLVLLLFNPMSASAGDAKRLPDPNVVVEEFSGFVAAGEVDKLASGIASLVGSPEQSENLARSFAYFKAKKAEVTDRVLERKFGTSIFRVVMYHSYSDLTVLYIRYTFKRMGDGWVMVNFEFKTETQELFPPDFLTPE